MAYTRKDYAGGAAETTITASINGTDTTIPIAASSGWPSGTNGPFVVVIGEGTASEEKILCSSRTGLNLAVSARGYDGTSGTDHASGAAIAHCLSAVDFDEANYAVAHTVGKVTTAGDLLVASGANAFNRLAKGSNSTLLGVDSGGTLGYTTVTSAMIADGTIVAGDLASDSVNAAKIVDGSVGTDELANSAVTSAKIADAAVTAAKIASAVAGDGLSGGAGTALSVNTGTSSATGLEISSDTVRVASGAAGAGLTGGGGSALAVGAGTGITVNADDVAVDSAVITTGALSTWSPTIKQGSSTASHTVETAKYHRTGRLIHCHLTTKITATVGAANAPNISLPVAAASIPAGLGLRMGAGTGMIRANGTYYYCHVWLAGSPVVAYVDAIYTANANDLAGWGDWATALKNNDYIDVDFSYEAAS